MGKLSPETKELFERTLKEYYEEINIVLNTDGRMRQARSHFIDYKSKIRHSVDKFYESGKFELKYIYLMNKILDYFLTMILLDEQKYFDLVDKDVLSYYNLLKNIWDKLENVPNALLIINTAIEISNLKNYDQSLEFLNKFNLCYCFDEEEVNKVKDIINGDKLEDFYNLFMTLTKRMIDKDYKKYLRSSITPKLKEILDKKNLE